MATRSFIGKRNDDGTITGVYCHWDGYPEWNGKMLVENYNTFWDVVKLINLGSISSLRERGAPPTGKYHTFDNPREGVTIAYTRDRGEYWGWNAPRNYKDVDEIADHYSDIEWIYVYDPCADGYRWMCSKVRVRVLHISGGDDEYFTYADTLRPVTDVLAELGVELE